MKEENKMSRRQAVAGLATALAAVAISPALAANRGTALNTAGPCDQNQ